MSESIEITHKTRISEYGMKHGRLDYKALSELLGQIVFNGTIRDRTMNDWEMVNGKFDKMVMADYIVTPYGAKFLIKYTDEYVFYNSDLDVYIWATTHWGDDWSKLLSNVSLDQFNLVDDAL